MKLVVLVAVLGTAGCDSLFSLVHVADPDVDASLGDGRADDATLDGKPDAKPCTPIGHNEDTDSIDDACDSCLSVANQGVDSDGDGIDDACDPELAGGKDAVLYATGFPSMSDFTTDYSASGVSWAAINKGQLTLFENASLTLRNTYAPTKIVLRTSGVGVNIGAEADVSFSGATCQVWGSDCSKASTANSCLHALPGGASATLSMSSANIKTIELVGPTTILCKAATGSSQVVGAGTTATFGQDMLSIETTSGGSIIIDSIEIFGTQ